MTTAISGLSAQSAAFGNIGDNLANSQTVGYKRIDTQFEDYLTTSTASVNQSGSVVARPDYVNTVQGTIAQTSNPLDMAIAGQGFLSVSQQVGDNNGKPVFKAQTEYTREGDFSLNKDGYMVNGTGHFLNGWIADATGALNKTGVAPIVVSRDAYPPQATSTVTLQANLPATPSSATPLVTTIPIYDSLGTSQNLQLSWTKTATPNTWSVSVSQAGSATPLGTATIDFGTAGNPSAPAGTVSGITGTTGTLTGTAFATGAPATLGLTANFGLGPQTIAIGLGNFAQSNGLTQYAGQDYNLRNLSQDGVQPGSYSGVSLKSNGDVAVDYDNGRSKVVARVPLVTFAAADSLQREDGQAFSATQASGNALTMQAGNNGVGTLVVSATEGSNVDIASEFSKLIVAQRAYSANTKMVTTAEDLLQQTIDMKR
ncbi:MAG: flagellar hook protein FlgE [Acetobacteraceae bacterium]